MKKLITKTLTITGIVLFPLATFAGLEEYRRVFKKGFKVNHDDKVVLNNRYGDIHIHTWEKDSVIIEVTIRIEDKSADRAEASFSKIQIEIGKEGREVRAITKMDGFINSGKSKVDISYAVFMPRSNDLDLENRFGSAFVDDLDGKANIKVGYGNLHAHQLNNKDTHVKIAFGNGEIEKFARGTVGLSYADLSIEDSKKITAQTKFSKMDVDEIKALYCNSKYDKYHVTSVGRLKIDGKFSHFKVDSCHKSLDADLEYGGLTVENIPSGFEYVTVENKFGNIKLYFLQYASFSLDASAKFGDVEFPRSETKVEESEKGHTSYRVKGRVGKSELDASKVSVTTQFGNVKIAYKH